MIKVLVNGCKGKMGQEVIQSLESFPELTFHQGFDKENSLSEIIEKPDIIIDFSIPKASFLLLEYATAEKVPVVIATTGFTSEEEKKIKEYAKQIPIFKSANMSYDINLMKKVVALVAKALEGTDIEITETHHNRKIDAPSRYCFIISRCY